MAFTEVAAPLGCPTKYRVSKNNKRYTLMDLGFKETKQGNFQLKRSLDPSPQIKTGLQLKITIDKSLHLLKMSIVDGRGLNSVNIFTLNHPEKDMIIEKYFFVMAPLLQRECLEEVL